MDNPALDALSEKAATYAPSGLRYAATSQDDVWFLHFADPDCRDQWFGGEHYDEGEAQRLAIDAWNRYAPAWSVRLLRTVTLDEVRTGHLTVADPAAIAAAEARGREAALKPTRRWASTLANLRQGRSSTPRCEPPGEADIERALDMIRQVTEAAAILAKLDTGK